jgi:copper chaperone CopZ
MRYARNSAFASYDYAICIFRRHDEFRILVTSSKTLKTLKTPETFIPGGPMAQRLRVTQEPGTPERVDYLSRAEVAAIFCVAPSTVTRWADEGRLACVRTLGGHRRYVKESVVQLVRMLTMLTKEEEGVDTITLEIPKLYGDHHTSAVHQALAQLPGVSKVWVSAAQHKVQINFDLNLIEPAEIAAHLAKAGYPTREGMEANIPSPSHKDPAWAELGLRMTETYSVGAKA